MFLFKKKKSDNKLSTHAIQQQQQQQKSVELTHPKPPKKPLTLIDPKPMRPSTPPSIIMPKPRRLMTPTRAILGRYDHDKTQVEEEEVQVPDIISPILLPTLHREQDIVIHKPVAVVPKKSSLQKVHSHSTASSNNSSKLYESAQEYLSDEEENARFSDVSSFSLLKKQGLDSIIASDSSSRTVTPGARVHRVAVHSTTSSATITPTRHKSMPANITLAAVATTTAADVDTASAAVAAEYTTHKDTNHTSTAVPDNTSPHCEAVALNSTKINSNPLHTDSTLSHHGASYDNVNRTDKKNTFSANNDTHHVSDNNNNSAPDHRTGYDKEPIQPNDTKHNNETRHVNQEVDELNLSLQKQKEEQDILLHRLTKQVEMMEKQRILDREEWCKKEQELLAYRQVMMNTLDETQQQLSNVLKTREEQKEKEMYYQQQLQLQQLQQLQQSQQVAHQQLQQSQQIPHQQQEESEESEGDDGALGGGDDDDGSSSELELYGRQSAMNEPDYNERRVVRCKSEEYMRYHHSRSSSRASLHHTQYYPQYPEEERRSVSRRNSNNSNKSYRLDPSPSTTIVANPMTPRGRMSRPRARSIEAAKWNENVSNIHDAADMLQHFPRTSRRSRSVGRRPRSRGSVVYYDNVGEPFDDYDRYYEDPRYSKAQPRYGNEYYMPQPVQPTQYAYYTSYSSHAPPRQQHGVRYRARNYDYH